jgi:hypothetical protein
LLPPLTLPAKAKPLKKGGCRRESGVLTTLARRQLTVKGDCELKSLAATRIMVARIKIEFVTEVMKPIAIRRAGSKPIAPALPSPGGEGGVAVTLSTIAFGSQSGVPVAHNGVVTPNHPDMVWLIQRPATPAAACRLP